MYSKRKDIAFKHPFRTFNSGVRYSLRIAGIQVNGPQVSATIAIWERRWLTRPRKKRREEEKLTDSNRTTDPTLSLLNSQIGQKYTQDILRSNSFSDVTETIDCRPSDGLLVSF